MNKRIGLMFVGQGAQQPGMGKDLAEAYPAAAAVFRQADKATGRSISGLCFDGTLEELTACANCQPALFTVSMACLAALKSRLPDFAPSICGGLSLGEYAALAAAGAYDLTTAVRLVAKRGELMDEACRHTSGTMAAVLRMEIEDVEKLCERHDIDIANLNGPGQQIISGPVDKVDAAIAELAATGKMAKKLTVAGAYHSRLMAGAADEFAAFINGLPVARPTCPIVQNFTGRITEDSADVPSNLIAQISGSVKWESCVRTMMKNCDALVELGPGNVLTGLARRIDRDFPVCSISGVASLDCAIESDLFK